MVDIIVLVFNQPEITEKFFKRVKQYTSPNYRLIVVDNGSDAQTGNIIKQYADKIIRFEKNVGFTLGVNKALDEVKAPFFCLLNNDILVTPGWLIKMLKKMTTKCGAIGAISNFASGKQLLLPEDKEQEITSENYEKIKITLDPIIDFSIDQDNRSDISIDWKNLEKAWQTNILAFFAVLFKSEVIKKVGKLDERFSPAYSEDWDYCFRMKQTGYDLLVDRETFVYHYGELTAKGLLNTQMQYQLSHQKLVEKCGAETVNNLCMVDADLRRLDPHSVVIGIPNMGSVSHYFLLDILSLAKPRSTLVCEIPRTVVHMARNEIVKFALKEKVNWIFFIDSDIRFPPNILIKFLQENKDLIGAVCTKRVPPFNPCVYRGRKKMPNGLLGWTWLAKVGLGIQQIDGIGMATTLVKTKVFKKLEQPFFYFTKHIGEDLNFCERIQKLGFKLYCDTDILCGHEGEPNFHGWPDFVRWAEQHGGSLITASSPEDLKRAEAEFDAKLKGKEAK